MEKNVLILVFLMFAVKQFGLIQIKANGLDACKISLIKKSTAEIDKEKNTLLAQIRPENNPFINNDLFDQLSIEYESEVLKSVASIPVFEMTPQFFNNIKSSLDSVEKLLNNYGITSYQIIITSNPNYEAMTCWSKDKHYLFFHPNCFLNWNEAIQTETILHEIVHMLNKDSFIKFLCMRALQKEKLTVPNMNKTLIEQLIEGNCIESLLKAQEHHANVWAIVNNPFYKEAGNPPYYNHVRDQLMAAERN